MRRGFGTLLGILLLMLATAGTMLATPSAGEGLASSLMLVLELPQTGFSSRKLVALASWLTAGFLVGLASRNAVTGVYAGVLSGTLAGIVLDGVLLLSLRGSNIAFNSAGLTVLMTKNLVAGFMVGVASGLAGGLGGYISSKVIKPGPPKVNFEDYPIRTVCRRCGASYNSKPVFCSSCGEKLRD